jgi:glycosyltransferase involved in cell wall biosynthesis
MKKICLIGDEQGWVLDEITKDFKKHTTHKCVHINNNPDIVWFLSPFLFDNFRQHPSISKSQKVVVSVHHIDETKIHEYNFKVLSKSQTYLVPNNITEQCLKKYTGASIFCLPYWLLSKCLISKNDDKIRYMKRRICPNEEILIGSFVKDGNGKTGDAPKWAKNPDLLIDVLAQLKSSLNIKVLLAGYARNYVIHKLEDRKVSYAYFNKYDDVNLLYDCLDWYLATSRYEGGPQSVLEASYRKIKILSTDVGMASKVLHPDCICNNTDEFVGKILKNIDQKQYNYDKVVYNYLPDIIIRKYDDFFENL